MIVSGVKCVGLDRQSLHKTLHGAGFRGGACRVSFGRRVECRVGGEVGKILGEFSPNVLSLSGFPGLKNLSLKCLFLKSLVFRKLAVFAERVLNKLKRRAKDERTVFL